MGSLTATTWHPHPVPFLHTAAAAGSLGRSRGARDSSRARFRIVGPVAYMERNPNSLSGFASKVIGSLPLVGLLARIFSDEGGVGDDLIDFAEFRRRVGKKCSITDSRAFIEFKDRRGRKRAKTKASTPEIPIEIRIEKAFEAIYICCFGKDPIEEEDERLLCIMLNAVFPSVERQVIERIVNSLAVEIAEGKRAKYSELKPLPKEALQRQMKDLQLLQQRSEKSS